MGSLSDIGMEDAFIETENMLQMRPILAWSAHYGGGLQPVDRSTPDKSSMVMTYRLRLRARGWGRYANLIGRVAGDTLTHGIA